MNKFEEVTYIVQARNINILEMCASGGAFTTLAHLFINDNSYVCGAVFDDNFNVKHICTNKKEDIYKFSGSKYVQSEMGNIFKVVRNLLNNGNRVLFSGTPCQVAGLKSFIGNMYDGRLFTVDLVCHGVPSPKLWRMYINYTENKRGPLKYVNFRSKRLGYHVSVMEERNIHDKRYFASARTNLMTKLFFQNICDRPCCYSCSFKTIERKSDITLYDCWHAKELVPNLLDNDKGFTNIIVHSESGMLLINKLSSSCDIFQCDTLSALNYDGSMALKSTNRHKNRDNFFQYLTLYGIENAVTHFMPISKLDLFIEKIKVILHDMGILGYIRKVKK